MSRSEKQLALFGGVDAYGGFSSPPLSSPRDPLTSDQAAVRQTPDKLNAKAATIMAILRRAGRPLTYREIFSLADSIEQEVLRAPVEVARRLPSMRERGLVRSGPAKEYSIGMTMMQTWTVAA